MLQRYVLVILFIVFSFGDMRMFNSTITRKKKPCKRCGVPSYIFSKGRCVQCSKIESVKDTVEDEEDGFQDLVHELDTVFSQYIRLKYADRNGEVKCFTCGVKKKWQEQQCGHYIPRANMFLRFDSRNCKPQCKDCNEYKRGNMPAFIKRLNEEKPGLTDILHEESLMVYKYTRDELKGMIALYINKVRTIKQEINKQ